MDTVNRRLEAETEWQRSYFKTRRNYIHCVSKESSPLLLSW